MKTNKRTNTNPLKIVFFGTPKFATKILELISKYGYKPILLVTAPDKARGRKLKIKPPVAKIWAESQNVKTLQTENLKDPKIRNQLLKLKPDLFIVASFGKILPKKILEIPKFGALNIHPSLLPKLRGPSPIQTAILQGEKESGVTIILMNEKMDEGPIIAQEKLKTPISNLKFPELEEKLAELAGKLLIKTIPKWLKGEIKPRPQNHQQATYTKIIKKKDAELNWQEPPEIIERKIRAFTPWPGAYTFVGNKRIIITEAKLNQKGQLEIKRLKPEGKREMDFEEYLKGNPNFIPEKN